MNSDFFVWTFLLTCLGISGHALSSWVGCLLLPGSLMLFSASWSSLPFPFPAHGLASTIYTFVYIPSTSGSDWVCALDPPVLHWTHILFLQPSWSCPLGLAFNLTRLLLSSFWRCILWRLLCVCYVECILEVLFLPIVLFVSKIFSLFLWQCVFSHVLIIFLPLVSWFFTFAFTCLFAQFGQSLGPNFPNSSSTSLLFF